MGNIANQLATDLTVGESCHPPPAMCKHSMRSSELADMGCKKVHITHSGQDNLHDREKAGGEILISLGREMFGK